MIGSRWYTIDQTELNKPTPEEIRGVEINLFFSPYDVPVAVRGGYDRSIRRFLIEFKYIDDEPVRKEQHEHLTLRIGKRSHRLYAIEVDVDALGAQAVSLKVHEMISRVIQGLHGGREDRSDNYELAERIISDRGEQLFEGLNAR